MLVVIEKIEKSIQQFTSDTAIIPEKRDGQY